MIVEEEIICKLKYLDEIIDKRIENNNKLVLMFCR